MILKQKSTDLETKLEVSSQMMKLKRMKDMATNSKLTNLALLRSRVNFFFIFKIYDTIEL